MKRAFRSAVVVTLDRKLRNEKGGTSVDFFELRMDIEWYRYLASLRDKQEPEKLAAVHNLADARKVEHDERPKEDRKAS